LARPVYAYAYWLLLAECNKVSHQNNFIFLLTQANVFSFIESCSKTQNAVDLDYITNSL